ncbi:MAG: TauD/TfdA family dioxygenase [Acidobacteria bacterium]|nr:TauD/TfdA family dioxygenase [Acidobacteriota bacterium]
MFELQPITGVFGAEVMGLDLTAEIDDPAFEKLQAAFVEHKVLLFRDQHDLTAPAFARFGRRFGELEVHPFYPPAPDAGDVAVIDSTGTEAKENWHSDVTFQEVPPLGSILRAIDIPAYGRDTMFADMEAAYAGLSEPFRRSLEGLRGVHDWRHIFTKRAKAAGKDEQAEHDLPPVEHPVVRTHPVTGRKSIFVNSVFTTGIAGMRPVESAAILRLLYDEVHHPEYQLRVRWAPGTVAMWDNRSTQHALVYDSDYPRLMERVQIRGTERPS